MSILIENRAVCTLSEQVESISDHGGEAINLYPASAVAVTNEPFDFDALIAPVDRATFLMRHLGTKSLHQKGAAGRFQALVGWPDIQDALQTGRLEAPRLQVMKRGRKVDQADYTRDRAGHRILDAGALTTLLSQGAGMVLNFSEEIFPPLRRLADSVESALEAHVNINLYAGWGKDPTFDRHFDAHDVIVLQVRGKKRWQVYDPEFLHPVRTARHKSPRPTSNPGQDIVLEDGDLLFIPRGWWHEVEPLDSESLHITIAISSPTARDLLMWIADRIEDREIGRADVPPSACPERRSAYFRDMLAAIVAEFGDDVAARFAEAREAGRPAQPCFRLDRIRSGPKHVAPDTPVRLSSERRIAFTEIKAEVAQFRAGGRDWKCDTRLVPAIRMLRSYRAVRFSALSDAIGDASMEAPLQVQLLMLQAAGAVFLDDRK